MAAFSLNVRLTLTADKNTCNPIEAHSSDNDVDGTEIQYVIDLKLAGPASTWPSM